MKLSTHSLTLSRSVLLVNTIFMSLSYLLFILLFTFRFIAFHSSLKKMRNSFTYEWTIEWTSLEAKDEDSKGKNKPIYQARFMRLTQMEIS